MVRDVPDTLVRLSEIYGSPLNIVWPHTVEDNFNAMAAITAGFGIEAKFYYGVKVNKSQSLLQAAVTAGTGLMYPACMNSTMLSALDAEATICVPLGLQNNTFLQELILQGRGLLWIQSRKWTTSWR